MTKSTYDLSNEADFNAFAAIHGKSVAKSVRFVLAYGVNSPRGNLKDIFNEGKLTDLDYAKIEAAFASQGLLKS